MPLADDLVALAALAGNTVVAAAATDAWETARHGIARLFGRGGGKQARLAESRLEETRMQLTAVTGAELELERAELAKRWAGRLADLLEEDPAAANSLRVLIGQVGALLPTPLSAADHSATAERDMNISASGGGVAAAVMDNPVVAAEGGIAIGHYEAGSKRAVASLPVSLPPRPAPLAGREDLLARLHAMLTDGDHPRTVVLCGLGGAGKTSLAAEYAHRHLADFGVVWQLAAEDPAGLAADMANLAAQLGAWELADSRDPVTSVHAVLAVYSAEWLLVFDNAPDETSVRRFLPPAGRGRVLITSQSALWRPSQVLEVPVLDTATAAGFLVNRTGDLDKTAAEDLAVELGGLPLALAQAAAYIYASGSTLEGYLAMFRQRRTDLIARGRVGEHPASVVAILAVALSRLEADEPDAAGLLRLLACLAAEPVPLDLLLASASAAEALEDDVTAVLHRLASDRVAASDAVAALRQYSLVTLVGRGMLLVHRLVQDVTVAQMPDDQAAAWRTAAAALIEVAIPADTGKTGTWTTCAALLPHAQLGLADDSSGIVRLANYLTRSGNYAAAREFWRKILRARERHLGAAHADTLNAHASFAHMTGEAGDAARARDLFAALAPVHEQVRGPRHPDTLQVRSNLAGYTGRADDSVAARGMFAALVALHEQVLGPEHPETLTTRANLAGWTGRAGDPVAARDMYAALLPVRERVLGAEHPQTLITRYFFYSWAAPDTNPEAARERYATLVPIMRRVFGVEHPRTLAAQCDLADLSGDNGDPAAARDQFTEVLPVIERVLGPDHPDTLAARARLTRWTGEADNSRR